MKPGKVILETEEVCTPSKAVFEAQDVCTPAKYTGPERRRENRRSGRDRRENIRFEIHKEDRRQSHGRRHDDVSPKF
jgi:hypothetical protein